MLIDVGIKPVGVATGVLLILYFDILESWALSCVDNGVVCSSPNACHVARRFLSPQYSIIRYLARRSYNVMLHLQPTCLIYKSK